MTGAPRDGTRVVRTRAALHAALGDAKPTLVATMGALHPGHAALIREARARSSGSVVVSIYVNPLQFSDSSDLDAYPRPLEADVALCADEGADIVFVPDDNVMHPNEFAAITIDPGPLGTVYEGAVRPGHFRAVLTVVHKLLRLTAACATVFGEKDYQQLVLVQAMVTDLELDVDVIAVPVIRDGDLPWSSRNVRLDADGRDNAQALSRAVQAASTGRSSEEILSAFHDALADRELALDYAVVTDPQLGPVSNSGEGRLLVAARVGGVRILDNVRVVLGEVNGI